MPTYFVANAGSDSNAGTSSGSPFLTIGKAVTVVVEGDTVNLNGGDTFNENPLFAVGLTLQPYGTGIPTIAGAITADTLTVINPVALTINGLAITNPAVVATDTFGHGCINVNINDGLVHNGGVTINGCTATGGKFGIGVLVETNFAGFFGNVSITNNTVTNSYQYGIFVEPTVNGTYNFSNMNIQGNTVSGVSGYNHPLGSGAGIWCSGTDNSIGLNYIQDNHVFNIGQLAAGNGAAGPTGVYCYFSKWVIFQWNVVHDIFAAADFPSDGAGVDIDDNTTSCSILYNYCYNCQGCGLFFLASAGSGTHTIAYNLVENCATLATDDDMGSLSITSPATLLCYNNTIISYGVLPAVAVVSSGIGCKFFNNVFITPAGIPTAVMPASAVGNTLMDGNYHRSGDGGFLATNNGTNYTSLAAWKTATGFETSGVGAGHCYFSQPQPFLTMLPPSFAGASALSPVAGSPLFNAGANLLGTYGIVPKPDFLGNPWTQNTIGAIYSTATPTAYAAAVYADHPIAYWRLAEPSGTKFFDSVASFEQGTLTSVSLGNPTIVVGDGGTSGSFASSSSSFGQIAAASVPHVYSLTSFSVEVWFKPTSVTGVHVIVDAVTATVPRTNVNVLLNGTQLIFRILDNASGSVQCTFPTVFVANTLYHFVGTWTGTTLTGYINGASQTPTYTSQVALSALPLTSILIGAGTGPSNGFDGLISSVSIYPTVLSGARALAHYNAGSTVNYSVTGPLGGSPGVAATFTITPTSTTTDSISITSSVGGDTITTSPVTWSSVSDPKTFTISGTSSGPRTITLTSSAGDAIVGSPFTYNVVSPFTVSGPSNVFVGDPATITFTPSVSTTDVVTPNDGGEGGTFSPATLTFSGSSSAQTTQYTPGVFGAGTISGTSSRGAVFTGLAVTSYQIKSDAYLEKSGKKFVVTVFAGPKKNGNYVPAAITTVNADPVFKVNGSVVSIGPAVTGSPPNYPLPIVAYLAKCGSVQSIAMVNAAGNGNYTAPVFTAPGCTFGTPVVVTSGLIAYTITSFGSGYTTSFGTQIIPGGQSPSVPAFAWVTVVSGAVTAVTPMTGSSLSYGIGYTGSSITAIGIPGSSGWKYDFGPATWTNTGAVPGTGLVVTATVGKYIQSVPVVSGGSAMTAPPTITISDSGSGSGATAVAVMTGPLSTDTITYTTTPHWINATALGLGQLFPPPATNATVANWAGQFEGVTGRAPGFAATPTMAVGGNMGLSPTFYASNMYFTGKNKLKAANPWQPGFGCTSMTLDATYYPSAWTPSSWVTSECYGFSNVTQGETIAQYQGTWALQYDDDFYAGTGGTRPQYAIVQGTTPVAGPHTTLPVVGAISAAGGAVLGVAITSGGSGLQGVLITFTDGSGSGAAAYGTITAGVLTAVHMISGGFNYTGAVAAHFTPVAVSGGVVTALFSTNYGSQNAGGNFDLHLGLVSDTDGIQHVHNPWLIAPNNTIDRSKPYACDDKFVADFTNNGKGPGVLRFLECLGSIYGCMIDPSDLMDPSIYSWDAQYNWNSSAPLDPPNQPTFAGTCTSSSITVTNIASTANLVVGQAIVGHGIPGFIQIYSTGSDQQTKIASIVDANTITLTNAAQISGVQNLSVNPTPSGRAIFTIARPYNTSVSPFIYSSENWAISGSDSLGTYLDVRNGPKGSADNGSFIVAGATNNSFGLVELVSPIPHGMKTGQAAAGTASNWNNSRQFTGTITNGSPIVTVGFQAAGANLLAGQKITDDTGGNNSQVPGGTFILSTSTNTFTMSQNATFSGSVTLHIITAFDWTVSGNKSLNDDAFSEGTIWVTGPNTLVLQVSLSLGGGTVCQSPVAQVPIYLPFQMFAPQMCEPYEFCAATVANWTNTAFHITIPWVSSDACVTAIAQKVAANIGPTNPVLFEMGDEPWNALGGPEQGWENVLTRLALYLPNGTSLYPHFTPSGGVASYVTVSGTPINSKIASYAIRAANKHYVFCQAWQAAGLDPARVKMTYNGQYETPGLNTTLIDAVKANNLPQQYIMIAPYQAPVVSASFAAAQSPAGYAGVASPGNWPVDAINDFTRHYMMYGVSLNAQWATLTDYIVSVGSTLTTIGYEGAFSHLVNSVPFAAQLQEDALYHSSFRDLVWGYLLSLQIGDPNTANSGFSYFSYFSLYGNFIQPDIWKLADSVAQPLGLGASNQFTTPQGGSPGNANPHGFYQTNQSPGLQALRDWIGLQNSGGSPTTPVVTRLGVNFGAPAGGTTVVITGVGFTGATAVAFGATPAASFVVNSNNQITAVSPAGTGVVDITVTGTGGTSPTSNADRFNFTDSRSTAAKKKWFAGMRRPTARLYA